MNARRPEQPTNRALVHLLACLPLFAAGAPASTMAAAALTPIEHAVMVTTGLDHTCALTTGGGVKCWGFNGFGQLGDSSTTNRLMPVDVSGLASGVTAIAAGAGHTCALATGGGVKCWGSNGSGQLGDSSTTNRLMPVDVSVLATGVTAIAAGGHHTCALTTGGGVKCWGFNGSGQLGDNSTTDRPTAVDVSGLAIGVTAIAAGGYHTCALTTGGGVKCWGANESGQLGDNHAWSHMVPSEVPGLASGVTSIAAGDYHTCALTTGGAVKCWGVNYRGQLGDNSTAARLTPVDVSGLAKGVTAIAAGGGHTCALTTGGGANCWGGNGSGQLGDNSTTDRLTAVDVSGLAIGVTAIAAGGYHTCALTTGGAMKCWGANSLGALGDNSMTGRLTPVDVSGLASGVTAIAAGGGHTCALTTGGGVKCWGQNAYGQLGDDSLAGRLAPVDVSGLASGATAIAAGGDHTCALTTGGGMKCWGNNGSGQLGDDSRTRRPTPVDVSGLSSGVTAIAAGGYHTCAVATGGGVKCWGDNDDGQLGTGTARVRAFPADVLTATVDLSITKDGAGNGIVTSSPPGIDCGATCSFAFAEPVVTLNATAAAGSVFTGWSGGGCSGTGACTVTLTEATTVAGTFVIQAGTLALAANPASVDFGGQSMGTTSPAQPVTVTNVGNGTVTVSGVSTSNAQFAQTHNCTTLAVGASCTVNVSFSPAVSAGALLTTVAASANLAVASNAAASPTNVALSGTAEKSLASHYYRAILNRAPDAAGKAYWEGEAARLAGLQVDVNETWYVMAGYFFNSAEYLGYGKNDTQFITDLYNTFFNRPPDGGGLAYWAGQIAAGVPREVVLFSFMFSPEFRTFNQAIFGDTSARAEVNVVIDFFRGILNRLPDTASFNYWLGRMRTAQCAGAGAVYAEVNNSSYNFIFSAEYAGRNRNNTQFVTDMYYSFLRRGGDAGGVQYWVNQLNTGARTIANVRDAFIASPEFNTRVNAIVDQGCLP